MVLLALSQKNSSFFIYNHSLDLFNRLIFYLTVYLEQNQPLPLPIYYIEHDKGYF